MFRLKELQKYSKGDGVLSKMQEFTAARLSVSKVSEEEWNFIVDELIEGYEEDAALPNGAKAASTTTDANANGATPTTTTEAKETIESDPPTTDTLLAPETAATSSRPASRAG